MYTTTYQIEGFRSLRDFFVELAPGMNVLVGPNGSGKTNFLDFLGFLDVAVLQGATNAISAAGGVAKVFSQESTTRNQARLEARISGIADLRDVLRPDHAGPRPLFSYTYEFELKFSRAQSSVYFAHETLRLSKLLSEDDDASSGHSLGTISVGRNSPTEDASPVSKVSARLTIENDRNPLAKIDPVYSKLKIVDRVPRLRSGADHSLLAYGSRYEFPALEAVRIAMVRGRSFNISPSKAREAEDISSAPGINRDGSGLAATLFALQSMKRAGVQKRRIARLPRADHRTLDEIVEWTKLVFPELQEIQVSQDPHTGKFAASLQIASDPLLRIPLQSASDGTLKWLSLVALVLTSGGVYSIEEPENFLHPKMQQNLVQLIRESTADVSRGSYFVFSTHSETLINNCHPEELVLFEFIDGSTACSRIDDPSDVLDEINRTGFGLGYYFASNALPQGTRVHRRGDGEDVRK